MSIEEKNYYIFEGEDEEEKVESAEDLIEESIAKENVKTSKKLDYTLETPEERIAFVNEIINETPPGQLTDKYLEILANYVIFAMTKQERKEKHILTDNRMVTINKRETSFEGLVEKLENGEMAFII